MEKVYVLWSSIISRIIWIHEDTGTFRLRDNYMQVLGDIIDDTGGLFDAVSTTDKDEPIWNVGTVYLDEYSLLGSMLICNFKDLLADNDFPGYICHSVNYWG